MKHRYLSFPAILLASFLLGCGSDEASGGFPSDPLSTVTSASGDLEIEVRTSPQPPRKGAVSVELTVRDASAGDPVEGLQIVVEPWMSAHGHGSNQGSALEIGGGVYEAEGVLFSMPGPWELRLHFEGARSDTAETASFEVLP